MTIYYRGPDALITHRAFTTYLPCHRSFAIAELSEVHVVRGDLHPVRVLAGHTAGAAVVIVAASWPFVSTPGTFVAAALMVAAPSALSGACCQLTPRAYELRATWRSLDVGLYCTVDARVFGQVKRALMRSLEHRDEAAIC